MQLSDTWLMRLPACAGVRLAVFDAAKKLVESAEAAYAEELERAAA